MSDARNDWSRVKALFAACLERTPQERALLLAADDVDGTLRAEVEALLASHDNAALTDGRAADWAAPLFAADLQ